MRALCASVSVLALATAAAAQLNPVAPPPEYREFTSKIYRAMYLGKDDNLPELIIVGVDSKQGDTYSWGALRFVNLTPTRSLKREAELKFPSGIRSGEGPAFLRVLTEELLPDIDRRYRTSDDRTLTMIEHLQRFVSVVNNRRYDGLSLESHVFDDETHMSSEAPITARGLRVVFRESPSK